MSDAQYPSFENRKGWGSHFVFCFKKTTRGDKEWASPPREPFFMALIHSNRRNWGHFRRPHFPLFVCGALLCPTGQITAFVIASIIASIANDRNIEPCETEFVQIYFPCLNCRPGNSFMGFSPSANDNC